MSGPKKEKVKLSEQGVVTEEAMIAYLRNELSAEDKQQLEKLLEEDPFAQDALEGLKTAPNQSLVSSSITSLNKKVRERSGLKERKKLQIHWVNYVWAIVVFGLLIGTCFILINYLKKGNKVEEKPSTSVSPSLTQKDTAIAAPKVITVDTSTIKQVDTTKTVSQSKPPEPVKTDVKTVKSNTDNQSPPKVVSKDAAANSVITNQKPIDTVKAVKKPEATPPVKKETPLDIKDIGSLQDNAMKSFNSGDYNTASDDFEKILKHDPENADALYFGGISDYINNKIAKSENNFDRLLKKGSKYIEGSKWYKANILIKRGKSEAAKPLLQDLSNTNGSYKERAIKRLAEMGF